MNLKLRYSFLFVFLVVCFVLPSETVRAQTSVGDFNALWEALDSGASSISLSKNITGTMLDEGEKIDFVLDNPITGTVRITTGGRTIRYSSDQGDDDYLDFVIAVGEGGKLVFSGAADISGGYSDAGAFFLEDGDLTFEGNANLHDNYSTGSGGAIQAYALSNGTTLSFAGLTLQSNRAESEGGAIALYNSDSVLKTTGAAVVKKNQALGGGGGGIYAQGSTLTFGGNVSAEENQASGDGGAFNLDTTATLTISGTATFTKNAAEYDFEAEDENTSVGGGAIYANNSTATFKGETVFGYKADGDKSKGLGNTAKSAGGAIYSEGNSTFVFEKSTTFGGNTATAGSGGAVYLETGSMTFSADVTFQGNEAKLGDAGAVFSSTGTLTFNGNTTFKNNTSTGGTYGGGALYADMESTVTFKSGTTVVFEGNKVVAGEGEPLPGGGAVYLNGLGTPTNDPMEFGWTLDGTGTFTGNEAAGKGGAVYAELSALRFGTATFSGNISRFATNEDEDGGGGAIYSDVGSVIHFEKKATFQNNQAVNGSGGAIFLSDGGNVDADAAVPGMYFKNGADFTGNMAGKGGAFYLDNSAVAFGGATTVSGNAATTGNGGAFYIQGDSLLHFEAGSTATFSGNTAGKSNTGKGGAIYVADDSTLIMKLGNGTGTGSSAVTIAAGSSSASNDVYLASGSTLEIIADTGSKLTINSAFGGVSRDDGDTFLNIRGAGTVELNGNTNGFKGDLTIEQGTLVLGAGAGTLGDLDNTVLTLSDGGSLVVGIDQNKKPGQNDLGRIQVSELVLDPEGKQLMFNLDTFSTNTDADPTGYALISLNDSSGKEILEEYLANGLIGSKNSSSFFHDIRSQLDDDDNEIWTLYVWIVFDPNDPNTPWTFNIASGTETLSHTLDNTNTTYPGNRSKELTVNGAGILKLAAPVNKVGALNGNGNVEIDGTLQVNGQALDANTTRTFTGSLTGDGIFVKSGAFTQQLLGSNADFDGSFDVQEGKLVGNSDSLRNEINVASQGTLVFDQSTLGNISEKPDRTFEGTLKGSGTVRINGVSGIEGELTDSVLRFNQDSSDFTGNMYVDRGWLFIGSGGSLTGITGNNAIYIESDGGLSGNGHVGNVVVKNEGAVQAYQGALNVDGNFEIQSGGILYVMLDSSAGAGFIDVTGTVTIQDGARFEIAGIADDYKQGDAFVFLSGGDIRILGNVESAQYTDSDGYKWTFKFDLDDDGNLVGYGTRGTDPGPGPDPEDDPVYGLSRNRIKVAETLAVIRPLETTSLEMKDFIDKLDKHKTTDENGITVYDEQYRAATKQLAGAIRVDGLQLGLYSPYRTVFNRLHLGTDLYGGSPVIYNNGFGPIAGLERHGAGAGPETYRGQQDIVNPHFDGEMPVCNIPCMMGENNFWADVVHVQTKTRGDGNSDEYGISRTGLLIGMDLQKKMSSRVGFLFGYFAPYLWQHSDRVEADDFHGGLYFQKKHRGTDFYGYVGYAHQEYESRRYVDMGIVDPTTYGLERYHGKTRGDSFNFSIEMSKPRYYRNNYILRPLIAMDYFYTSQKGYAEHGPDGGLFGLSYDRAEYDQLFVRLGMNLKKECDRSTTVLRIQYINQFGSKPYPDANARFLYADSPAMNIRGVDLKRDYLNLGFGYNLFMNESRSKFVSFDYDVNMSRRTTAHGFSLVLVERF